MLAKQLTFLSAYNFTIEHRRGRVHDSNVDALSRRPCLEGNCRYCKRVEETQDNISIVSSLQISDNDKLTSTKFVLREKNQY